MARFGDYLLVRRLGEGSHGRSFLAEPPLRLGVSDEYVVVKVLHREVTDDDFSRAAQHLAAVASVMSPYLARPLDAVRVDRSMGVVTEHVAGGSLDAPGKPISRREVMQAVADAGARGPRPARGGDRAREHHAFEHLARHPVRQARRCLAPRGARPGSHDRRHTRRGLGRPDRSLDPARRATIARV